MIDQESDEKTGLAKKNTVNPDIIKEWKDGISAQLDLWHVVDKLKAENARLREALEAMHSILEGWRYDSHFINEVFVIADKALQPGADARKGE